MQQEPLASIMVDEENPSTSSATAVAISIEDGSRRVERQSSSGTKLKNITLSYRLSLEIGLKDGSRKLIVDDACGTVAPGQVLDSIAPFCSIWKIVSEGESEKMSRASHNLCEVFVTVASRSSSDEEAIAEAAAICSRFTTVDKIPDQSSKTHQKQVSPYTPLRGWLYSERASVVGSSRVVGIQPLMDPPVRTSDYATSPCKVDVPL